MPPDPFDIVQAIHRAFLDRARADDAEQAVYSIDSLDELQLHPLIQSALAAADFGVWPEQRYPSDRTTKAKSTGRRCDIVLTPDRRPLLDPDAQSTLFADDAAVPLEAAYWLEIKTVSQFTTEGPFPRYSAELLSPVSRDIKKMAADPRIFNAALLLILFTASQGIADHDLLAWHDRCIRRGYPVAPPIIRAFPITDRLGNAHASIALFPVRRL